MKPLPLFVLGCSLSSTAMGDPAEPLPSIELLEYLAEFVETDDGRLLGPLHANEPAGTVDQDGPPAVPGATK